MENEELRQQVSELRAMNVALLTAITALIQTHHDHTGMQLAMTDVLERSTLNGKPGSIGSTLTPDERAAVRHAVEWLGSIRPRTGAAPPVA